MRDRTHFRLEDVPDNECKAKFRFDRQSIVRLRDALHFPGVMRCRNGKIFESDKALSVLLRRLAHPNKLADLKDLFNRDCFSIHPWTTCALITEDFYKI